MGSYNVNGAVVKKPSDDVDLTPDQEAEWMKCALDPEYWMETYAYVQGAKGKVLFKPRPYQKRIIRKAQDRFFIGLLGRQSGKALSLDTVVPTPTGYTTMGEIEVGDYVIGDDGRPVLVTATSPVMHDHTCYEVKFSTGESIIADAEHLWTVNHKKKGVITVTTQQMVDSGILCSRDKKEARYSITNMEPMELPEQKLPIDPYVLGYWLGDGTSDRSDITVCEEDLPELIKNIRLGGYEPKEIRYPSAKGNVVTVRIECIRKNLGDLDLLKNKHIPIQYLRSSKKQRVALLQGIMDSDGSACKKGRIELTFKSKHLIEETHELISSLGIRLSHAKEKIVNTYTDGAVYYRLNLSAYTQDFDLFRLSRKLIRQAKTPNIHRKNSTKKRQIISITEVDSVPVRCIAVNNQSHLFCVGKSFIPTHNTTTLGILKLHKAIFFPDTKVGVTSYKLANVKDYLERIKYAYENLPFWMKPAVIEYNRYNIKFTNDSFIVGQVTKENTFRGLSLTDIVIDELAFVKPDIAEEFWTSLLPSMSAEGDSANTTVAIISTPNGTGGLFASLWFNAVNGSNGLTWEKVEYEEIPGRTPAFEADMIKKMGLIKFLQEFKCHFLSDKSQLINSRILETLRSTEPVEEYDGVRFFTSDWRGRKIAMSCDPGEGIGQDYHAIQIFDLDTLEQLGEYQNNILPQSFFTKFIIKVVKLLFERGVDEIFYTIENNAVGTGILRLVENCRDPVFERATLLSDEGGKKLGMNTNSKSKLQGCLQLKDMIELGKLKINSELLITQFKFFVRNGKSYAAEKGMHDDLCMAMVVLMNMLVLLVEYDDGVYEVVNEVSGDFTSEDEEFWGVSF